MSNGRKVLKILKKKTKMQEKIKEQIVALLKGAEAAHAEYVKDLGGEDEKKQSEEKNEGVTP